MSTPRNGKGLREQASDRTAEQAKPKATAHRDVPQGRRRFLIVATGLGLIEPRRVVDQVLREIEGLP